MAMLMFPWTHWASQKVVMYQENTCSLHEVSASGHKAYLMPQSTQRVSVCVILVSSMSGCGYIDS